MGIYSSKLCQRPEMQDNAEYAFKTQRNLYLLAIQRRSVVFIEFVPVRRYIAKQNVHIVEVRSAVVPNCFWSEYLIVGVVLREPKKPHIRGTVIELNLKPIDLKSWDGRNILTPLCFDTEENPYPTPQYLQCLHQEYAALKVVEVV